MRGRIEQCVPVNAIIKLMTRNVTSLCGWLSLRSERSRRARRGEMACRLPPAAWRLGLSGLGRPGWAGLGYSGQPPLAQTRTITTSS